MSIYLFGSRDAPNSRFGATVVATNAVASTGYKCGAVELALLLSFLILFLWTIVVVVAAVASSLRLSISADHDELSDVFCLFWMPVILILRGPSSPVTVTVVSELWPLLVYE